VPDNAPRLNQSADRASECELTANDLAAIEAVTQLDQRLYAAAQTRFSELVRTMLLAPANDATNSDSNEVETGLLPEFAEEFDIEMSMPVRGRGWHEREGGGSEPVWRWTGPSRQSTIELPLAPGRAWLVMLHIISVPAPDILTGMHVMVGSNSLKLTHAEDEAGNQSVTAHLTPEVVERSGRTEISILVPRTLSHADIDPACRDRRPKGLAITRISAIAARST
jgi:hypothetical protein